MFPELTKINETKVSDYSLDGTVFKFDFSTGHYELLDGNLIPLVDPNDKVKQWLKFLIKAEYDHVAIYKNTGFGLSLKKYVGKKSIPLGLIASEVKEQLDKKVKLNKNIKEVSKVTVTKNSKGQLNFDIVIITNQNAVLGVSEIV